MTTERFLKFFFFVTVIVVPNGTDSGIIETGPPKGVYWRPWSSWIPEDAIVAGNRGNAFNESLYFGQLLELVEDGGLQPGAILEKETEMEVIYHKLHKSSVNANILCASDPKLVTWKHQNDIPYVNDNPELVIAGVEDRLNNNLFFGKVTYNGETFIGKVRIMSDLKLMHYCYYGVQYSDSKDFEILVYSKPPNSSDYYN